MNSIKKNMNRQRSYYEIINDSSFDQDKVFKKNKDQLESDAFQSREIQEILLGDGADFEKLFKNIQKTGVYNLFTEPKGVDITKIIEDTLNELDEEDDAGPSTAPPAPTQPPPAPAPPAPAPAPTAPTAPQEPPEMSIHDLPVPDEIKQLEKKPIKTIEEINSLINYVTERINKTSNANIKTKSEKSLSALKKMLTQKQSVSEPPEGEKTIYDLPIPEVRLTQSKRPNKSIKELNELIEYHLERMNKTTTAAIKASSVKSLEKFRAQLREKQPQSATDDKNIEPDSARTTAGGSSSSSFSFPPTPMSVISLTPLQTPEGRITAAAASAVTRSRSVPTTKAAAKAATKAAAKARASTPRPVLRTSAAAGGTG